MPTLSASHRPPPTYYLDSAFINSGTDNELDVLFVILPNNSCSERNMTYLGTSTVTRQLQRPDGTNVTVRFRQDTSMNISTFVKRYFSYGEFGAGASARCSVASGDV